MKGCSKSKRNRNRHKQRGGCHQCLQTGGSSALVGAPWTSSISNWPGVAGIAGTTNHYAMNQYKVDPQTQTTSETNQQTYQKGGYKRSRKRGGGIIPQDLVNLGRGVAYGLGSAYNSLAGYPTPVNPLPYKDQLK
jgi:hypothetical protein